MTMPDTPLEASPRKDPPLGWDILAALRYGLYSLRSRLGTRGLVIVGAAVIAVGLALNWSWLVAIGVAPLLLTVLPCVAMCALGLCMMPKHGKSPESQEAGENPVLPAKGRPDE
jgi:hypothetical protein